MEREDRIKYFTKIIIMLVVLRNLVKDKFFLVKLDSKTHRLIESFLDLMVNEDKSDVAQYEIIFQEFADCIETTMELINDLRYLNLIEYSPLLYLRLEKNLLALKLRFLKGVNNTRVFELKTVKRAESQYNNSEEITRPKLKNNEVTKLNQNKEKILNFIKSYPNKRTKEIIYEFNAISDRTVKRSLNELLRAGLIKKRVESKASYYSRADL